MCPIPRGRVPAVELHAGVAVLTVTVTVGFLLVLSGSTSTSRPEKWDVRPSDAARPPGSNLKIWGEVEYAKER